MNLLASVLPGIRELRGPLVVGYTWLLAIFFIVDGLVSQSDNDSAVQEDTITDLSDLIGRTGVFAVASVAAYLLGAVTIPIAMSLAAFIREEIEGLVPPPSNRYDRPPAYRKAEDCFDDVVEASGHEAAMRMALTGLDRRGRLAPAYRDDVERVKDAFASLVIEEAEGTEVLDRLLVKDKDLYGESDRHRAEASFGSGGPPAIGVLVALWIGLRPLLVPAIVASVLVGIVLLLLQRSTSSRSSSRPDISAMVAILLKVMMFSVLTVTGCCRSARGAIRPVGWAGQPRRVRAGRSGVFGPGSPARSALGELP